MSPAGSQTLLYVLGVHRSGTSALCAALASSGVSFGDRLIDAMAGVNDEGFWEDAGVVAINEQLLALADSRWYALAPDLERTDWTGDAYRALRERAKALLRAGFGGAALQAVKDPRLCLTLPFWLALSTELGITTRVCVIGRAPLEVARSLHKRDGFPLGYGLRLYAMYRRCIDCFAPADALYVGYGELLEDTPGVMARLAQALPLAVETDGLAGAVRVELRHQAATGDDLLSLADAARVDLAALDREIEARYPVDQTLAEFAHTLVTRGLVLAQIGEAHTAALTTIDERDADIAALSALHREALATIDQRDADIGKLAAEHREALATLDERDEQIREFDRRLATLGDEHSYALDIIRERDAQLAAIRQRVDSLYKIPGVGYLIRRMWKNAQG